MYRIRPDPSTPLKPSNLANSPLPRQEPENQSAQLSDPKLLDINLNARSPKTPTCGLDSDHFANTPISSEIVVRHLDKTSSF